MALTVGFAGLGLMGSGVAGNLSAAGYSLNMVAHRRRIYIDELIRRGAKGTEFLSRTGSELRCGDPLRDRHSRG